MKVISAKDGSHKVIRVRLNPDDPEYRTGLRQKLTVTPGPTRPERSTGCSGVHVEVGCQ